jgi:hypothetical protein
MDMLLIVGLMTAFLVWFIIIDFLYCYVEG